MTRIQWMVTAAVALTVVIATLSVIGFVTADELGGFALVVGGVAWAVSAFPLFVAAVILAEIETERARRRRRGDGARADSASDASATSA
jgi:hypothetical protein